MILAKFLKNTFDGVHFEKKSISKVFFKAYLLSCQFNCVDTFCIKFRFFENFSVMNFVTRLLFLETPYRFRIRKCLFAFD